MDYREQLQRGIQAAEAGDFEKASTILVGVVDDYPSSEEAWLWLGKSYAVAGEREFCFRRVLQINPDNDEARTLLGGLDQVVSGEEVRVYPPLSPNESLHADPAVEAKRSPKLPALTSGFALALVLCGIPFLYLVFTGRFQLMTNPFAYASQTVTADQVSSSIPSATALTTPTPDLSSLPYSERFKLAGPDVSDALENSWKGRPAESILAWSRVIEIVPEWSSGYYHRGEEYLKLLNNQGSQEEFLYHLSLAGRDFDKAIELEPYANGGFYYARFQYYNILSSNQTTRVDSDHLESIALDNLLMANRLGNYEEDSEVKVALVYLALGRCDEGIEQADQLIAKTDEPSVDMIGSLAIGYFCKNDTSNALKYMNQVVDLADGCQSRFDRARIYYVVGRLDDALADLDATIAKSPYFCGLRYYLRGLIYAENGDFDKAQDDLAMGMAQTWERGGLLSYALGKIALARNDKEAAIQYFQDAELTYPIHDPILLKMREDLSALGASPLDMETSLTPVTPIATPTLQPTRSVTLTPMASMPVPVISPDALLQDAPIVDLEKTIGPIKVGPGSPSLWHFQAAQPLEIREVKSLSVWLISSDTSQRLPIQLFVLNFRKNIWESVEDLKWGENRAGNQNELVSGYGDVFIYLVHQDDALEITVDALGITLVIQRPDGSIEVHGITP